MSSQGGTLLALVDEIHEPGLTLTKLEAVLAL